MNFAFALSNRFSTTLVCGFENDIYLPHSFCRKRKQPLLGSSRPDDWLAASMADFTSLLKVLCLKSDCESPHEFVRQRLRLRHCGGFYSFFILL